MAILRIINFGGLVPSANPRALPPNAANTATDMHPSVGEFRPTLDNVVHSGLLTNFNPRTIYRFERNASGALVSGSTEGWLSYADIRSLARWPGAADSTERTTVSRLDGSSPPRVIDATGTDRPLGLPAPTAAPVVTLTDGDYYTEEDRDSDVKKLRARVLHAIRAALVRAKVGAAYTADAIEGFLESGTETGTEPSPQRARVYRFDSEDGTLTDAYTGVAEDDVRWVTGTRKGVWILADGTPAWMGAAGTVHYAINYHAYGIGYKLVTEASLLTALDAVQYIDTTQATDIAGEVADLFDPLALPAQAVIKPLKEAVAKLEDAINKRAPGMTTEAESSALQDLLLQNAAREIWNLILSSAEAAEDPGVTTGM